MTRPVSCSGEGRCYGAGPGSVEFEISVRSTRALVLAAMSSIVWFSAAIVATVDVGPAELSGQQRGKS